MAEIIHLEIKEVPAFKIIGKEIRPEMSQMGEHNPIPGLWDKCFEEGLFLSIKEKFTNDILCEDYVGWMGKWNEGDGKFTYVVGMMVKPESVIDPGELVCYDVPAETVAIGWCRGENEGDVIGPAHDFTNKALMEKGYTSESCVWCMELYNCPRFTTPDEQGRVILDYYLPCKKKDS